MTYQSRRKNYKSPREKNQVAWRNSKVIALFVFMALVVWVYKNRYEYWSYLETYFY